MAARFRTILVFGTGLVASGVLIAVLLAGEDAPAAPSASWTPSSLEETVLAGDSITVPVSFTAGADLTNVVAEVVPELQPYVHVSPEVIGNISQGQTIPLDITFAPPPTALPGTFDGTIHLRSAEGSTRTFARPLPVIVEIEWVTLANESAGYSMLIPPSLKDGPSLTTDPTDIWLEKLGATGYILRIELFPNQDQLPLDQWLIANPLGGSTMYLLDFEEVMVGGVQGLLNTEQDRSGVGITLYLDDLESKRVIKVSAHPLGADQEAAFFGDTEAEILTIIESIRTL